MDRAVISTRIKSIKDDIRKLSSTLFSMENMDIEKYPENYAVLSTEAALKSELIACRIRHLLYSTTRVRKQDYLASASKAQGIEICENNGILSITLPCLLPKKKQRQSSEYLIDPLYFTLSQYADSHMLPYFKHCVVCFSHIYSQQLPETKIRDYDNLEMKQVLDVLATFIMEDDTGLLVDAYNTTELGDQECTCISIMDKSRFPRWLQGRETGPNLISDFQPI